MGARSAHRDRAGAADALSRILGAGAPWRLGRARHRCRRTLCELERPAADPRRDPPAGHLPVGLRDLADRGRAVPHHRLPVAAAAGESARLAGRRDRAGHRDHLRHRRRRPVSLGVSGDLSANPAGAAAPPAGLAAAMAGDRGDRLHRHSRCGLARGGPGAAADIAGRRSVSLSRPAPVRRLRRHLRDAGGHRPDIALGGERTRSVAQRTARGDRGARSRNRRPARDHRVGTGLARCHHPGTRSAGKPGAFS